MAPSTVEMHSLLASNASLLPGDLATIPSLSHAAASAFRERMSTFVPATADEGEEYWSSGSDDDEEAGESEVDWYSLRKLQLFARASHTARFFNARHRYCPSCLFTLLVSKNI